jgi:hypothetical protein
MPTAPTGEHDAPLRTPRTTGETGETAGRAVIVASAVETPSTGRAVGVLGTGSTPEPVGPGTVTPGPVRDSGGSPVNRTSP